MSDDVMPCEHGSYGLCPQCVREERDRLRAELAKARSLLDEARAPGLRGALLWLLWHHQGGSSPVGQPLRRLLGIGQHDRLTDDQLADAKSFAAPVPVQPAVPDDVALAYGVLWHVNNMRPGYDAPAGHERWRLSPEKAAYKARHILRELLSREQRGDGINRASALLAASKEDGT